jgi:hypothetical protein
MRKVLVEAPDGLRTIEIWGAVQRALDRPVSNSTIKSMLAGNSVFIRMHRGLYRLRDQA